MRAFVLRIRSYRGRDPFAGFDVPAEDLRRACEAQAKSHVIHLREGFLESRGEATAVAQLIARSAGPLRSLLSNIARLPDGGAPAAELSRLSDESLAQVAETRMGISVGLVRDVFAAAASGQTTIAEPSALLSRYLDAGQRIWDYVDRWRA